MPPISAVPGPQPIDPGAVQPGSGGAIRPPVAAKPMRPRPGRRAAMQGIIAKRLGGKPTVAPGGPPPIEYGGR